MGIEHQYFNMGGGSTGLVYLLSSPGQGMPGLSGMLGKTVRGHGHGKKTAQFSCLLSTVMEEEEQSSGKTSSGFAKHRP